MVKGLVFVKPSDVNDGAARLKRIEQVYRKLAHTVSGTPEYKALIEQIRAEADALRKIIDAG